MKRLLILAALLAWLAGGSSAQNSNPQHSLDATTRSFFEQLDKSTLQSGILLQQSAMWVNPFRFDGTVLNDSNQMDASRFGILPKNLFFTPQTQHRRTPPQPSYSPLSILERGRG